MTSIVEIINHYQKSIDRSLNDETRLLHCISKLYRLPVSVQHLQETGIGRTVNGLRKYDGEVGVAAKALVSKWKSMVAAEESDDGGDQDPAPSDEHRDTRDDSDHEEMDDDDEDEDNYESRLQVDEHAQEDDSHHEEENDESPPRQQEQHSRHHQSGEDSDEVGSHYNRAEKSSSSSSSRHKTDEHRRSSKSSSTSKSRDRHEKESKSHHSSSKGHSSSSDTRKSSGEKDKKDKHGSGSKSSSEKKESSQSSAKKSSHDRESSGSSSKHHTSSKLSKTDSENHKRKRSSEADESGHSKRTKKEESSEKSRRDKSNSSKSGKKKGEDKPVSDEEDEGLDSSAGASFADALAMIGVPSSSKKKNSSKSSSSGEKSKKSSSSMPPPAAKTQHDKTSSSSSKSSRSKDSASPNSTASGRSNSSSTPSLLTRKVELEPLPEASEIVESLPIISPNYKPMPLNQTVMGCVFGSNGKQQKVPLTEEEALGHSMQSKNMRTKVYSGVKTFKGEVPSLFDLCIRLLQENIDLLDMTGGIPFDLLKPVLEKASPQQLSNLEEYNPYLMEDSDILWETHCKRLFRQQKRKEEECESWREMFFRCSEERDAKLRSLTRNIKQSQVEKAAPIRKTQMAYIDSVVKPPRNVMSKQAKYGTDRTPVVSPAARVAALKNATSNVAKAGDARLKVAPGSRDTAQAQAFHPMKPKKAPLMTKVMASIKGLKTGFRR